MRASVIICTYSLVLVPETIESVRSILEQEDWPDKEIILVMDENEELRRTLAGALPSSVRIVVNKVPGLSEARNTGIQHATGDIIVFIDDDATAEPAFLSNLMKNYDDPDVIGVGGRALPRGKPSYPEELYWIGGYTYKGHPEERCAVRNLIGCNMSFRREVFEQVGLFDTRLGRVGRKLVTAEETEFCLRISQFYADKTIIYDPSIVILHKVHQYRQNVLYCIKRGYFEGKSKKIINNKKIATEAIGVEITYMKFLINEGILDRLKLILKGKEIINRTIQIIWIGTISGAVALGYLSESIKGNTED